MPKSPSRREQIEARLRRALSPTRLRVQDESALHIGHLDDDAASESHFRIEIVSPHFVGLGRLARHRAVYQALGEGLRGELHAVAIRARTPEEPEG